MTQRILTIVLLPIFLILLLITVLSFPTATAMESRVGSTCCEQLVALSQTVDPIVAQPADVLTYTVQVTNIRSLTLDTFMLSDPIPAGVTYVQNSLRIKSGLGQGIGMAQYEPTQQEITWLGTLAPRQVLTLTYNVFVNANVAAGHIITNTATVLNEEATVTTQIGAADDPAWVLLVYLSADNNLDNPNLHVIRDQEAFNALERAAYENPRLQIYVQWDRSPNHSDRTPDDRTRRYRVRPDLHPWTLATYTSGVDTWDLGERNMGDPQELHEFINWARDQYSSNFEALSIIGHGGGWAPTLEPTSIDIESLTSGIAWDDSAGDYLSTADLGQALYWGTDEHTNPFDVLIFDASAMALLENAYEIRGSTRYLVASQSDAWARFAYDEYVAGTDDATLPFAFAEKIATSYRTSLEGYPLATSALALNLTALDPLVAATDQLAIALTAVMTDVRPHVYDAYSSTQIFDSNWDGVIGPPDAYVDLYDLAMQLQTAVPNSFTDVHEHAQAIVDSWPSVMIANQTQNGVPWTNPEESWNYHGANGLSIYFPIGEDLWVRDTYRDTELSFAADTDWDEMIHEGWYAGSLPPQVAPAVLNPGRRPGLPPVEPNRLFLPLICPQKGAPRHCAP